MSEHRKTIQQYLTAIKAVINKFPIEDLEQTIKLLGNAREQESTIFVCGDGGGSWSIATNMVYDLGRNVTLLDAKGLHVISLGDNFPALTAYAEEDDYERVFAEPLSNLMKPDDVLIAISGDGNSPTILKAIEAAREIGGIILGLTGFSGGKMKDKVDHCLVIPSDSLEMISDFHLIIDHLVTICLRK